MSTTFAQTLKTLRAEKGLSQRELADQLYVTRSTITRWESGSRLPDAAMMGRLAACLGVDANVLLAVVAKGSESPHVLVLDDRKVVLIGALPVLEEVIPSATFAGFTRPSKAIEYAKTVRVSLAFVDIELGKTSGFDVCRELLRINPQTNVIFLTAYAEHSLDAWNTGASGFMTKPITPEGVREQLKYLRYPLVAGGSSE